MSVILYQFVIVCFHPFLKFMQHPLNHRYCLISTVPSCTTHQYIDYLLIYFRLKDLSIGHTV
jgi:hypothetical protein